MLHNQGMSERSALVARRAESLVSEALEDTRVVLINGARQSGKSTLTRQIATGRPATVVRLLDDPATLRAAQDDPTGFVDHSGLMIIDEIQLVPELLRPIKVMVDFGSDAWPLPAHRIFTGAGAAYAAGRVARSDGNYRVMAVLSGRDWQRTR